MRYKDDNTAPSRRGHHHGKHGGGKARQKRPFDNGTLRLMILDMVAAEPRHGYDIMTEVEARTAGAYRPSPGVLYPNIAALEADGLITTTPVDGRRKLCAITDLGRAHLKLNASQIEHRTGTPPKGRHWGHSAPPEIVAAMDALKAALRARFLGTSASPEAIRSAATAIQAAADTIETLPAEAPVRAAKDLDMTQIITRHRHELRRRSLTVRTVTDITPNMRRVVLDSPELEGFTSLGFDDHIKLFFDTGRDKPEMRDYTPRAYDGQTLTLDFALHDAGPATQWAMDARPGSTLTIGGPKGSSVIAPVFDWYLLIGDETALPAIGRKVEETPAGVTVVTLVAVTDAAEEQPFHTAATHQAHWVHRPASAAADPAPLTEALRGLTLPEGQGFIWAAAESGVARALKSHILGEIGHPPAWMKAAGYWTQGQADASDKSLD